MIKATKIKFGANENTNRYRNNTQAILAFINGEWLRVGTLEARTDFYFQNDGTERKLVHDYWARLNDFANCFAEVRVGSRYTGGKLVQSAASAKAEIKAKVLATLNG